MALPPTCCLQVMLARRKECGPRPGKSQPSAAAAWNASASSALPVDDHDPGRRWAAMRSATQTGSSTPRADPVMAWVVCLLAPLAMADDGLVATQRTPPREQLQRERLHPGSVLSSASGSAIKRITAGVKAGQ